jgi:hypothetical protein
LEGFKSEGIPDCGNGVQKLIIGRELLAIPRFLHETKEQKVTWAQIRRVQWVGSPDDVQIAEFTHDFLPIMTSGIVQMDDEFAAMVSLGKSLFLSHQPW